MSIELQPADDWQFTVEVRKTPQGLKAILVDARASIINGEQDPGRALLAIGDMLEKATSGLKADAKPSRAP